MKKIRRIIVTLASLMLAFSAAAPCTAFATGNDYFDNDVYIVKLFPGNEGYFKDGSPYKKYPVKRGSLFPYDVQSILANEIGVYEAQDADGNAVDSKYKATCIRESGKDNRDTAAKLSSTFRVNKDMDFVVAYGMPGGDVAYTVRYINDSTGERLAPDETFYGNLGEKPVVAFKFFDGMLPQAYNLTGTLTADEASNVFIFRYTPGDTSELALIYNPGGVTYIDGGDDGETVTNLVGDGGGAAGTTAGTNAGTTAADNGTTNIGANATPMANASTPASLIDIDDGSTPLASFAPDFDYTDGAASRVGFSTMPNAMKVGLGCLLAVIAAGVIFLIISTVRKRQRAESDG